jgi:plasmid stability protein
VGVGQILVRRLDDEVLARLKARALRAGRSLEEECRLSLAASARRGDLLAALEAWRAAEPQRSSDAPDDFADVRLRGPGRPSDLG